MEWLTRLPVVGPLVTWLMGTHLWRAYERLDRTHWTRLAAAMTFTGFLALFPLVALGAALGAATLTPTRMRQLEDFLAAQVPGISDGIDIQSLVDNAGTIGSIAVMALLFTGLGWVRVLRECLREVWLLTEENVGLVAGKLKDLMVLIGLGGVGVVSLAGSTFAVSAVDWTVERLGIDDTGVVVWLLRFAPVFAALLVDVLLLCYVLTKVPGVAPERRSVLEAALLGAVGFELLKLLLGGYLSSVAAKSMYGAFGLPVALLIWISLMARLTLFCTAWTATSAAELVKSEAELTRSAEPGDADPDATGADSEGTAGAGDGGGMSAKPSTPAGGISPAGSSPVRSPKRGGPAAAANDGEPHSR